MGEKTLESLWEQRPGADVGGGGWGGHRKEAPSFVPGPSLRQGVEGTPRLGLFPLGKTRPRGDPGRAVSCSFSCHKASFLRDA